MPGFWLLTEGAWAEGLSHAPGWFPCCPVLSCSMCYLCFYPSTGHGDQEKCDWSRLKAVFHSSLTQLHSLFFSLSLSLLLSPGLSLWDALPTCGVGWRSPAGEAKSLPAPPGAALLSCCWGLPAGQLVPSAVQSSLRYLAQSLSSCA